MYNQDNSKTSLTFLEIFMQNGKVGEGDVFSKKTSLLPQLHKNFETAS
jgi:hypothetical protein